MWRRFEEYDEERLEIFAAHSGAHRTRVFVETHDANYLRFVQEQMTEMREAVV